MENKKYFLHYRQSFSLLTIDLMLQGTDYLNIDYIHLYIPETNSFTAYLSKKGLKQARDLGDKKILNNRNWKKVFDNTKKSFVFIDKLKKRKIPEIGNKKFDNYWKKVKKHTKILVSTYFYCDEPTLMSLEEKMNHKKIYSILYYIGKYKLKAHKKLSVVESIIHELTPKVAKLYNLNAKDLEYLTLKEFDNLLAKGPDKKVISLAKKRFKGYVWFQKNNKWIVDTDKEYKRWRKVLVLSDNKKEVKGNVAYKVDKKIVGRAKIHISFSQITRLSKDEILVTGMTNPQMLPYIKNIKGIVTDEGGLMCHAAIISREMKIPCIVGTEDATQVFKNGDLIEIDTTQGSVRKV